MDEDRQTGRVVGTLFIVATVASILGSAVLGSALDGADYLFTVADSEVRVVGAVILFLTAATAAFATAFLLFPILRRHSEGLAAGYVGLRAFENVFYAAGTIGLLTILTVGQSDALGAASELPVVGTVLLALHDWSVLIGTLIFFGLGSLALNWVLYRSRLVPHWMSLWGLAGAVLVLAYGVLGLFGADSGMGSPFMLLAMPIALQEMVFAVWLIVKGFEPEALRPDNMFELHMTMR